MSQSIYIITSERKIRVNLNTYLNILFTYTRFRRSSLSPSGLRSQKMWYTTCTCILSSAVHYFATLEILIKLGMLDCKALILYYASILRSYIKFYGPLLINYLLWVTQMINHVFSKNPIFISRICNWEKWVEMEENARITVLRALVLTLTKSIIHNI